MAGSNKSRRAADTASSADKMMLRAPVSALRASSSAAANEYTVTASKGALVDTLVRPLVVGLVLLVLIWLALTFLGRFQLWMTAAGVMMVLMSVASAFQEFKNPAKAAQSYQDLLDETMESCSAEKISLPRLSPAKAAVKATVKNSTPVVVNHHRRSVSNKPAAATEPLMSGSHAKMAPNALNIASPAIVTNPVLLESGGVSELTTSPKPVSNRRKSEDCIEIESVSTRGRRNSSATEFGNKLLVLHCGTVIDIEGSHGFLIPHDLGYDAGFKTAGGNKKKNKAAAAAAASTRHLKLPLVIPFDLNEDESAVRQELSVGRTVEFAFSEYDSGCKVCALNVTPVSSDEEIVKSRHALLSCKQARQQSFAKAMCDLKMISPRNEPVKHVDLIKYAEKLDDHELPFDQFI